MTCSAEMEKDESMRWSLWLAYTKGMMSLLLHNDGSRWRVQRASAELVIARDTGVAMGFRSILLVWTSQCV